MTKAKPYRHRFPMTIIQHAIWLYHRFHLSYRDVQELLHQRGIQVSHEPLREWCMKLSSLFAEELRHRDEVCTSVDGVRHWLWRAVDEHGFVLNILLQRHRDTDAAKTFLTRLLGEYDAPGSFTPISFGATGSGHPSASQPKPKTLTAPAQVRSPCGAATTSLSKNTDLHGDKSEVGRVSSGGNVLKNSCGTTPESPTLHPPPPEPGVCAPLPDKNHPAKSVLHEHGWNIAGRGGLNLQATPALRLPRAKLRQHNPWRSWNSVPFNGSAWIGASRRWHGSLQKSRPGSQRVNALESP